jgi:hypothetical protein
MNDSVRGTIVRMKCFFCGAQRALVSVLPTDPKDPEVHYFSCAVVENSGCGLRHYIEGTLTAAEVNLSEFEVQDLRAKIALANEKNEEIALYWMKSGDGGSIFARPLHRSSK